MVKFVTICFFACFLLGCDADNSSKKEEVQLESTSKEDRKTCLSIIEEIVTTSDSFKEEVGKLDYIVLLERSPFPIRDKAMDDGDFYEFSFAEDLEDHISTIARFSFDPEGKKLFLYDPIEDELVEVSFNRKLLDALRESCV